MRRCRIETDFGKAGKRGTCAERPPKAEKARFFPRRGISGDLFEPAAVFVPFFARRVEVEDQIFHIEPKLGDRALNERENLLAVLHAADRSPVSFFETGSQFGRKFFDQRAKFGEIRRGVFFNDVLLVPRCLFG